MKKYYFSMFAAMLFAACSNDDDVAAGSENQDSQYMAINIVSNGASTRADETYADGEDEEVQINTSKVAFFFFDNSGNAYTVGNDGGDVNYSTPTDISYDSSYSNSSSSVSKLTNAILVLQNKTGEAPSKVVAVLNYTFELSNVANKTLTEFRNALVTEGVSTSEESNYYMMSNAAYTAASGAEYATPIEANNIATSEANATSNPVTIYVERVVAKVTTADGLTADTEFSVLDPSSQENSNLSLTVKTANGNKKYSGLKVKFLGWELFNKAAKSTVVKDIEDLESGWNDSSNHRSYWGNTSWGTTDDPVVPEDNQSLTFADMYKNGFSKRHPFENTLAKPNDNDIVNGVNTVNTSIALAAQIYGTLEGGAEASAMTLVKWLSGYYTLEAAKTAIANYLANSLTTYTAGSPDTWTPIAASDIDFKATKGEYFSYVTLKSFGDSGDDAESNYSALNKTTKLTITEVKEILAKVPKIQIWNEGKCYYFTTINHSGTTPGVVRNHWYQLTINSVSGLGTPVYDEENSVVPTKATEDNEDEWYLSTKINVLAWNVITQSVDLTSK